VQREFDVNVIIARKRKYDRLKRELKELEKLLNTGSKADLTEVNPGSMGILVESVNKISFDVSSINSGGSIRSTSNDQNNKNIVNGTCDMNSEYIDLKQHDDGVFACCVEVESMASERKEESKISANVLLSETEQV
jgi:hypothetical protein